MLRAFRQKVSEHAQLPTRTPAKGPAGGREHPIRQEELVHMAGVGGWLAPAERVGRIELRRDPLHPPGGGQLPEGKVRGRDDLLQVTLASRPTDAGTHCRHFVPEDDQLVDVVGSLLPHS